MIRQKKSSQEAQGSGFLTPAEKLYELRKRMKEEFYDDSRNSDFWEMEEGRTESRFREKDLSNIYDSME